MPDYARNWLGDRDRRIIQHGFSAGELALNWWNAELKAAGLATFEVTTDPNHNGSPKLTRGELFRLAPTPEGSPYELLNFLWHVLAWGSGESTRQNRRRISGFVDSRERDRNIGLLRDAAAAVQTGGNDAARSAYSSLIRSGGGKIPGLGPAFFTKYLYFLGRGEPTNPCVILDARVAASLFSAGWADLPHRATKRGLNFSSNWYTDTYVSYCETVARWASESNARPDEIERALFAGDSREP